jgi:hypothetical protein
VITNASPGSDEVVERVVEAGSNAEQVRPLGLRYPLGVYSLSHLALTFPLSDPLYGMQPDDSEDYGVNLGALAIRGERGLLIVSQDSLTRIASNPFFPYLLERVEEGIGRQPPPDAPVAQRLGAPVGATTMGSTR